MRLPCFPSHTLIHVKLFHISVSALVVIHTRHIYKPHTDMRSSQPPHPPHIISSSFVRTVIYLSFFSRFAKLSLPS